MCPKLCKNFEGQGFHTAAAIVRIFIDFQGFSRSFLSGLHQDSGPAISLFQCSQLQGDALPILQCDGAVSCMKIVFCFGDAHMDGITCC